MTIAQRSLTGAERILAACRRQPTDVTPVWFMRQAGRSLARYRALREQYPILTMAKTPDLCTRITVMPVDELGVDGAVLFADIMLPLEGMGVSLEIQPDLGPVIHQPIRDQAGVERLRPLEPDEGVPFVMTNPEAPISKDVMRLASALVGAPLGAVEEAKPKRAGLLRTVFG